MLRSVDQGKLGCTSRCGRYLLTLHESDLGFASRSFILTGYGSSLTSSCCNLFHAKTSQNYINKRHKISFKTFPPAKLGLQTGRECGRLSLRQHSEPYRMLLSVREGTLTRGAFLLPFILLSRYKAWHSDLESAMPICIVAKVGMIVKKKKRNKQ